MILEIILFSLYLIVPTIVFYKIIPIKYNNLIFLLSALFVIAMAWLLGYSWHDLGFRLDNLQQADGYYYIMFFLAFGLCAYFKQKKYTMKHLKLVGKQANSYWGFWFVPAQEIIFRSILFPVLLSFNLSIYWIIPIMSFLFGFAHIPLHSWKIFWLTFGMGVGICSIYVFFPNFYLVTILHGIVWITGHYFKVI